MIRYGQQDITDDDIESVVSILRSDFLTQGPAIPNFEYEISNYAGAKYSVAVNSATSALHIACLALDLGTGDFLWTSPNSFVASANCAIYCGANVDFVDIDADTNNMCPIKLHEKLIQAKKVGRLPKIVIPVHLGGHSCDMEKIYTLGKEFGFSIIEDASHAIGATYKDRPVGCCQYSDIAIYSFHPVKIITTGEGGIALTNNPELDQKMRLLRSHGITRDPKQMLFIPDGPWYYEQISLGFNYRITDIQAALGISQLKRVDSYIQKRRKIVEVYNKAFKNLPLILPSELSYCQSSWHLYIIRLKLDEIQKTLKEVHVELLNYEIGVNLHYIPIHTHPYYQKRGFKKGDFPQSERFYSQAISLPIHPNLKKEEQIKIIDAVKGIIQ